MSLDKGNTTGGDQQHSDFLHASITLAGIALALIALLADHPSSIMVRLIIFIIGIGSLFAAELTLRDLFIKSATNRQIYRSLTTMGLLFWLLLLLGVAYVFVQFPDTGNIIANWLQTTPAGASK